MTKKESSLILQQDAEKYLASLESSREQLTTEQYEVVIDHVKSQRDSRKKILMMILLSIIAGFMAFAIYESVMKARMGGTIGENWAKYNGKPKMVVELDIKKVAFGTKFLVIYGMIIGVLTSGSLLLVFGAARIPSRKQRKRKILQAFIPIMERPQTTSGKQ